MKIDFLDCEFGYMDKIVLNGRWESLCNHSDNDGGFCLLNAEMDDCPLLDPLLKLYILLPAEGLVGGDNPWDPYWDGKNHGFVIRAENETQARAIAHENAYGENDNIWLGKKIANTTEPWLDPKYSTCRELTTDGEVGIIMANYQEG